MRSPDARPTTRLPPCLRRRWLEVGGSRSWRKGGGSSKLRDELGATADAVEGGIDDGAHGSEFLGHSEEGGERRQGLVRVVDEVRVGHAHGRDAAAGEPGLGVADLLAVSLGDVRAGPGGLAEAGEHAVLAIQDFLHLALHEEHAVVESVQFRVFSFQLKREGGEEGGDDFERVAAGVGEPGFVGTAEQAGDFVVLVVAFFIGGVRRAAAVGERGQARGIEQLHHQRGAGAR